MLDAALPRYLQRFGPERLFGSFQNCPCSRAARHSMKLSNAHLDLTCRRAPNRYRLGAVARIPLATNGCGVRPLTPGRIVSTMLRLPLGPKRA